ncbi:MAG TPA: Sec-independent protein translocase protein TatB [Burkholderiaceae bacterium]|nr:Sec-independent protein translocase protein TatB [Burkholderiaceae bacterium]
MIDIGLTKIALVGLVALVVIGPEKLPTVARMAGSLFGRAQRYINQVKSEVSREIELEELRKMQKDVQEAASDVEQNIAKSLADTETSLNAAWNERPEQRADETVFTPFDLEAPAAKARSFRKKKLAHGSAVPSWYKRRNGHKVRVISGAARVARYRPASGKSSASFY